jgi:Asp-tRNA(Asn)/Glu-tRNA(Gln) amidotransferase A subunit family amidase
MKERIVSPNKSLQDWLDLSAGARAELLPEVRDTATEISQSHGAYISVVDGDLESRAGLLENIPYAVKDNIDVGGFETTAGTPFFRGTPPVTDANVVSALGFEGAIVVGKTNMHELAFGITSNNGEFGAVRNPLDPSLSAGGSSGGSAAAVALGNVPFALGTDTGGSITVPASFCGIVGFRPTTGRYPGDGVVNLSWSRDTVGIHANSVSDVRLVDRLITRSVQQDRSIAAREIRIGLPTSYFDDLDEEVRSTVDAAVERLRAAGVAIVKVDVTGAIEAAGTAGFGLVFYETARTLPARAAGLPEPYASLTLGDMASLAGSEDVRQVLTMISEHGPTAADYAQARAARWELRREYEAVFQNSGIDALAFPSVPVLPPLIGLDETIELNGRTVPLFPTVTRHSGPGSFAGSPMLSVPAGRTAAGLSVGLTLEGQFGDDEVVLAIGAVVESILS